MIIELRTKKILEERPILLNKLSRSDQLFIYYVTILPLTYVGKMTLVH
jgi:hypothetical protein